MSTCNSKDTFFKSRSMAGRLATSFRFINDNAMVFVKLGLYILVPMGAVLSLLYFALASVMQTSGEGLLTNVLVGMILLVVIVGLLLYNSLLYSLIKKYAHNEYLPAYTGLKQLKDVLIKNAMKLLGLGIVMFVIFCLLSILTVVLITLSLYTLILLVPLWLIVIIPLVYAPFVSIIEEKNLWASLKKSFNEGLKNWGATFTVCFVAFLLGGIIQFITSLPYLLGSAVAAFSYRSMAMGDAVQLPAFYPYLMILLTFLSAVAYNLAQIIVLAPLAFQYSSVEATERELLAINSFGEDEKNLQANY